MDWDEKEVRLYADDILLNRTPLDNTVNASYKEVANPFRQPHFIILNLALGATGGDPDKPDGALQRTERGATQFTRPR